MKIKMSGKLLGILVTFTILFGVVGGALVPGEAYAQGTSGDPWAWGYNGNGELGDGTTNYSFLPLQIYDLTDIIDVSAGGTHSLALKSDGTVWAWGSNYYGQLGNGTNTDSYTPIQVNSLTDVIAISAGNYHSLALKSDGTVWAWGYNGDGQLGNGTITGSSIVPIQVIGLTDVIAISAGNYHSLALKSDGTVWAWGTNGFGVLGNGGTTEYNLTPMQVSVLTDVIAIDAGPSHNLAIKSGGTVWS
jgi:alpha-tubulin suppressor-like RCC1 family protein